MKQNNKITIVLIILFVIFNVIFCSCSSNSTNKSLENDNTEWFNNKESYVTMSLEVAQEQTPFTIVLPTYLSENIRNNPIFSGPSYEFFKQSSSLIVSYKGEEGKNIDIREFNSERELPLNEDAFRYSYGDTDLVEISYEEIVTDEQNTMTVIPVNVYCWNFCGVYFEVTLHNFKSVEARSIVESMIE